MILYIHTALLPSAPIIMIVAPETIHPALWRASSLGRGATRCLASGHAHLDTELPGGGWPVGTLVDLLTPHAGVGEVRLLQPALTSLGARPIFFVSPPHCPSMQALANWGVPTGGLHLVEPQTLADALWSTEQILRAGTAGALLFWQPQVRSEALRRLHLAAQTSETAFFMIRPLNAANLASPSPLRLRLEPAPDGVSVFFLKRRGPARDEPLFVPLYPSPFASKRHAPVDRRTSPLPLPRSVSADLDA